MGLGRIAASGVELALQVLLGDLYITQGHADVFVTEQLHQSGKTDTQADHLRGIAVPQLVRRHRTGAGSFSGLR